MKLGAERFGLELAQGEVVRLEAAGTFEIACEEGRVWLTEESNARDWWLTAGQCARLSGRGLALVEAMRHARIRIGAPLLGDYVCRQAFLSSGA